MTTKAFSAQGFIVQIGAGDAATVAAGADTFTTIGEVFDVTPPSPTVDTIDVTHLASTIREFIAGVPDGGSATLSCNFIPDDLGQKACRTALLAKQLKNFRFIFPTTLEENQLDCKALVIGMPQKLGVNDRPTQDINLKVSSLYSWS